MFPPDLQTTATDSKPETKRVYKKRSRSINPAFAIPAQPKKRGPKPLAPEEKQRREQEKKERVKREIEATPQQPGFTVNGVKIGRPKTVYTEEELAEREEKKRAYIKQKNREYGFKIRENAKKIRALIRETGITVDDVVAKVKENGNDV